MSKKGFAIINLIISYWWVILIILGSIAIYNFAYDYFLPEYCLTDTSENRAAVEAYGFTISESRKNSNQICFRSNNQELVQKMYENIEDKRLQNELEIQKIKEGNRNEIINTLLEPQYFYPLLLALVVIGIFYIQTKYGK